MIWLLAFCLVPAVALAGAHDYFKCTDPNGAVSYSVERCPSGKKQRRMEDDSPAVTVPLGTGERIVSLTGAAGRNFFATISINGVRVRAIVDTGATWVTISPAVAMQTGLSNRPFRSMVMQTANGRNLVRVRNADTVDLGGNTIRNVTVAINPKDFGTNFDVLLGMSFLKFFEMKVEGGSMTLRRR